MVSSYLIGLLEIEQYIPVMTATERRAMDAGRFTYDSADIIRWEHDLHEKNKATERLFSALKKRCLR